MAKIFLCHASEDKPQVEEVYRRLRNEGYHPWMDKMDLLPGQQWRQEIPKVLKTSDFILVFLSRNSVAKRSYVQREFKLALDTLEEIPAGAIHTIPVRLDDCDVPEPFREFHWCDFFEEGGFERLLLAIRVGLSQLQQPEQHAPQEQSVGPSVASKLQVSPHERQIFSELLSPMILQLNRTSEAFRRWVSKNLYLESKIIREGNLAIRDLLLAKASLIPSDLIQDAQKLITHYDRWLEEYDRIRGERGTEIREDEAFVFVGPLGYPFPVESERRFRERFEQLRKKLEVDSS